MNTDDYAPEIKRLIKEFVNDYLRSPEFPHCSWRFPRG